MVHLKKTNLYIFIRNYVKFNTKKFCWYHANNPLTIELVCEQQLPILKTLEEIIHTRVTLYAILCEKIPVWQPHTSHYHHFNNRIFPIENPVKNGHDHLALLIIFSLTITVL